MKVLDLFRLDGKVAVITGASSGLGVVAAEALAEAGARVVLLARREEKLRRVVEKLRRENYVADFLVCDITLEEEVKHAVRSTIDKMGSIDILVNNAGITYASPSTEMKIADWRRVLEVNLTGMFLFSREFAKAVIKTGRGGKIINISSVYGIIADATPEAPYFTSKAGVIGLTRQLALEWAPHKINVNAIAPGFFPSEMTAPFIKDLDALSYTLSRIPVHRIGLPKDLKGVIVFLASNASDYITGQVIVVDGGWSLW
ncbi:MAG: glucose 1-dehydrogenase [Candidatus Caldarchaeales archaeon]